MKKSTASDSAVLLLIALLCSLQPAYPQNTTSPVSLITQSTETTVTGFKGTVFETGGANSAIHALLGVSSRERSDIPWSVTTLKENLSDSGVVTSPSKSLCGSKGATSSKIKTDFGGSSFQCMEKTPQPGRYRTQMSGYKTWDFNFFIVKTIAPQFRTNRPVLFEI